MKKLLNTLFTKSHNQRLHSLSVGLGLLLLLSAMPATAQKIHITDTTNYWAITGFESNGTPLTSVYLYNTDHEVWGGYTYNTLISSTSALTGGYVDGFDLIREDTTAGIVYLYDFFLGFDRVLYKYNLTIGDTVNLAYGLYLESGITGPENEMLDSVTGIDSVLINGLYYKVFSLVEIDTDHIHYSSYNPYLTYIEGLGSVFDPVNAQMTAMYFGDTVFLHCFYHSGIAYTVNAPYTYPVYGDTAWFVNDCAALGIPEFISGTDIKLWPNPATDIVTIEGAKGSAINIYNLMGQMALTQQITGSKQVVDISSFAGGVYIVQVVNSSGDVKNMRIVKL